jgi:acetyl-CoA acyltransferase
VSEAFICDGVRTPIGRYGGALSSVRPDDLGAIPIRTLMDRHADADWQAVDDVVFGCANQAGEDNRNVARMALLLAGMPESVPAATINRLCGSGMDAVGGAARAIKAGEADFIMAGGVESMSRAPFVMAKAESAFSRAAKIEDTTLGWRFVNKLMKERYGIDSMPETAENVAEEYQIARDDQDAFALRSQQRAQAAIDSGFFDGETVAVTIPRRKGDPIVVSQDEHPRGDTTAEALAKLPTPFREGGTVTAGNASGVNDGAWWPRKRQPRSMA